MNSSISEKKKKAFSFSQKDFLSMIFTGCSTAGWLQAWLPVPWVPAGTGTFWLFRVSVGKDLQGWMH